MFGREIIIGVYTPIEEKDYCGSVAAGNRKEREQQKLIIAGDLKMKGQGKE